jgi:xylan 1,4-beta-xylosidase
MVWHYHDDDVAGPDAAVDLAVAGLPAAVRRAAVIHYRIDEDRSNAYAAWKGMGSPIAPTRQQYGELEAASRLALLEEPRSASAAHGTLALTFALPRQAVSLVMIEWE